MTGKAANRKTKKPTAKRNKKTASKSSKPTAQKMSASMKREDELTPRGPLNIRQQLFAKEYCLDWNGTQAAIRAGYPKGSANRTAARLLSNVYIQKGVKVHLKTMDARMEITEDEVVAGIRSMTFPTMKETDKRYKVKLRARAKALEMMGRVKSMFKDTLKHTGNPTVAIINPKNLTEQDLVEIKRIQDTVRANGGNGEH